MYIHVFYLKTKLYGKITVFKTSLQHKQDKAYITNLYQLLKEPNYFSEVSQECQTDTEYASW